MPYYAVARGHEIGIYTDLESAWEQVDGYSGAEAREFSRKQALEYITGYGRPYQRITPNANRIKVYCDGASRRLGTPTCLAGCGLYIPSLGYEESWGYHELGIRHRPTNQTMELCAVLCALGKIRSLGKKYASKFTIYSDSRFAIDACTVWADKWVRDGWVKSDGSPVVHADLVKDCIALIHKICVSLGDANAVEFAHVRGHSGDPGNEMADQLANEGCERMEDYLNSPHWATVPQSVGGQYESDDSEEYAPRNYF